MLSSFLSIRTRRVVALLFLLAITPPLAIAAPGDGPCFNLYANNGAIPGDPNCHWNAATASGGLGLFYCTASSGVQRIERYCGMTTKNAGPPECEGVGNPVHAGTGNKFQQESDYIGEGAFPLRFERYYNYLYGAGAAGQNSVEAIGAQWRHTYLRSIRHRDNVAAVLRHDGREWSYRLVSGEWTPTSPDIVDTLRALTDTKGGITGWVLHTADDLVEIYTAGGRLTAIHHPTGPVHTLSYDGNGRLENVTDSVTGRALELTYANNRIATLTTPDGEIFSYIYAGNNLASITYPGNATRTYHYNESSLTSGANLPQALTGITDERGIRLAEFEYAADGRGIATRHAGGADEYTLDYSGNTTTVTEPLGAVIERMFINVHGNELCTSWTRTPGAQDPSDTRSTTYDAQGNAVATTDYNGNRRCSAFDAARNLETARLEGVAPTGSCPSNIANHTPSGVERKISRQWHPDWRMETARAEPMKITRWVYHGQPDPSQSGAIADCAPAGATVDGEPIAVLCARIEQATDDETGANGFAATAAGAPRIWRYTYNEHGQMLSEDGPRTDVTDVTTYAYYTTTDESGCSTGGSCHRQGDLQTVTNALGHVTTFVRYDRAGRAAEIEDPNNVTTVLAYHSRGWLVSHSVDGATTSYSYLPTGHVERITQPDGVFLDFEYDAAQRLEAIENALGERIEYTLDAAGNRTAERIYNDNSTLTFELQRAYDQLGRLQTVTNGTGDQTSFEFDAAGNLLEVTDALNNITSHSYDALNRLKTTLDALNGQTGFEYDARDNLTEVTDPEGLNTFYVYNGFDDLTELDSPDAGITLYTYDSAGNRTGQTDARGITSGYNYDALNRLTSITYPNSSLDVGYFYDEADGMTGCGSSYPQGRMTRMTDGSGVTRWCYDARGNVTRKQQNTAELNYAYNAADRLSSVTYPDGKQVSFIHDAAGQVIEMPSYFPPLTLGTIAEDIEYLPFGPVRQYQLGAGVNSQLLERNYDPAYRVTDVTSPALALHFRRDAVGNIDRLGTAPGAASPIEQYAYDDLYRLEAVQDDQTTDIEAYTYDLIGNRQSKTQGTATQLYDYATNSHRLTAVANSTRSYDAVGNMIADQAGSRNYTYGDHNRLTNFSRGISYSGRYTYNGRGERVFKFSNVPDQSNSLQGRSVSTWTRFVYDEAGRLLAEQSAGEPAPPSNSYRNYVYLGDIPVAVIDYDHTTYRIHADHLGTPRVVVDTSASKRWTWSFPSNPFGEQLPNQDPQKTGTAFTLNLRYPGQYYDAESGLHYNYFRDYEPGTGRYVQSDPKGLSAGVSTYSYAMSLPLRLWDFYGLEACEENGCKGINWTGQAGTVRCSNGQPVVCMNPEPCQGIRSHQFCEIFKTCVREHEERHRDKHSDCRGVPDGGLPRLTEPFKDISAAECDAFRVEQSCYQRHKCQNDPACHEDMIRAKENTINSMNNACYGI